MTFRSILLPVDGSQSALHAGRLAIELALAFGSMVHVMHCYDAIPGTIGGKARKELARKEAEDSCEALQPYRAMFAAASVPCELHVRYGEVAQEIVGAVEEYPCGLVIMGHRGLGSAEGFVLGSVSQKVLEISPVPVLVAK